MPWRRCVLVYFCDLKVLFFLRRRFLFPCFSSAPCLTDRRASKCASCWASIVSATAAPSVGSTRSLFSDDQKVRVEATQLSHTRIRLGLAQSVNGHKLRANRVCNPTFFFFLSLGSSVQKVALNSTAFPLLRAQHTVFATAPSRSLSEYAARCATTASGCPACLFVGRCFLRRPHRTRPPLYSQDFGDLHFYFFPAVLYSEQQSPVALIQQATTTVCWFSLPSRGLTFTLHVFAVPLASGYLFDGRCLVASICPK